MSWARFGPLASLAAILKHGKREDLLPHAPRLLECILAAKCQQDEYPLSSKYAMKIVARIGRHLIFNLKYNIFIIDVVTVTTLGC